MSAAPSPLFGPVIQNGYVVHDLEEAAAHWSRKVGVGPFFAMEHIQFGPVTFRGAPLAIDMSVAVAQWGEIQIELIVQHDASPSIYTEFATRHGQGLQHLGVMTSVQHGQTRNGIRFAYVDTDLHPGGMVEVIETGPAVQAFFSMVRTASQEWDGTRPLRRLT